MGFLAWFKDWMLNSEERKQFKEAWKEKNKELSKNSDYWEYHADVAYQIFMLAKKVQELEGKLS